MANFTNYTKLQLIVERTVYGDDGIVGGDYVIALTFNTATPTADANATFLGTPTATLLADSNATTLGKIQVVFNALTGVTAVLLGQVLTLTYDITATIPTIPGAPEASNGLTGTSVATDNRDTSSFLKHSEYEDSESGLTLATIAMYSLVAASALTDSVQMQRIKLSDSDTELITDNITQKVVGKNYQNYSV